MDEESGGVHNDFSGSADTVLQAGAIHFHRSRVTPHEVPARTSPLINRVREKGDARCLFDVDERSPVRIGVFSGLPGVGKTATVQDLAAVAKGRYPGGELYVDYTALRGPTGADVDDALAECLRALGVTDEAMPARLAERKNLYRTHTAERPVLVVLDEVTEPAQVWPLVPTSEGSTVLVTSNDRLVELVVDGAVPMPLEPLDADSGAHFLAQLCGHARTSAEPAAVAELVRLCGGLPVALRVVACRLVARRGLSMADLVAEIVESGGLDAFSDRESTVPAVFGLCYRNLSDDEALLYRRLGLLPGPDFTAEVAAVISGLAEVIGTLDGLVQASLLEEDDGRYRMHALVRRHAHDRALEDESESARRNLRYRLVRHYLVRAAAADLAVLGPGRLRYTPHEELLGHDDEFDGEKPKKRALEWMDSHRANLSATVRLAAEHGWHEETWQLAESVTALYLSRRHLLDWVETSELGARSARLAGRRDVEARLRSFVSRALDDLGEHVRAEHELEQAMPIAEDSAQPRLLASVHELVGRHRERTDPTSAIESYRQALRVFDEVGDARGVAFVTHFLGCALDAAGGHTEAIDVLRRALALIREVGDERMAGRALIGLGAAHAHDGDDAQAADSLREAADLLADHPHYEATAREALADVLGRCGDREAQRECLEVAWRIHSASGGSRAEELRARLDELTE